MAPASGRTLLDGWRTLGHWAIGFFGCYAVVWGFVYGATAMSAVRLALNALVGGMPVRYWAMLAGLTGLTLVWLQRYAVFEKFGVREVHGWAGRREVRRRGEHRDPGGSRSR
jgi:hypothetical protein